MWKDIARIVSIPVVVASLCCLSPVIIVLLGLGSVGLASSLADSLYGAYKWYFRIAGLLALTWALILYFRSRNICTFDEVRKKRNEVINIIIVCLATAVVGYIVFLYVVVHYVGVFLSLWS